VFASRCGEEKAMRRNGLARLGTGLVLVLLVAACGSASGGATTAPSAAPTPEPTAQLGLFTGHDVCIDGDAEGAPDTGKVVCDRVVTDARMTGTLTSPGEIGTGTDPDVFMQWHTFTMGNDGGAWTCKHLLMGVGDSAGWADQVCTGTLGYAGLTAYIHSISGNQASDFGVLGWIEETP
jgi:hypothetical protein